MGVRRLTGLLVLALLTGAGLSGAAQGASPGTNGRIAFATAAGGIDAVDPASGQVTELLPANPSQPRSVPTWAPDGRSLAYVQPLSADLGDTHYAVRYRLASGVTSSSLELETMDPATWTPDSAQIYTAGQMENSDGTNFRYMSLTLRNALSSSLSPGGTRVAYIDDNNINVANLDGTGAHVVAAESRAGSCSGPRALAWSPDESKLAYCDADEIVVVNVDGSGSQTIGTRVVDGQPSWSPDGSKLVFPSAIIGQPAHALATLNADGSNLQIVHDASGNPIVGTDPDWGRVPPSPPTSSPPNATSPPTISGQVAYGEILTASAGGWGGDPVRIYTYQWKRCTAEGGGCANIDGATFSGYTPGAADVGHRLQVVVRATNAAGSSSQSVTSDIVQKGNEPPGLSGSSGSTPPPPTTSSSPTPSGTSPAPKVVRPVVSRARATWLGKRVRLRVTACHLSGRATLYATDWNVVRKKAVGIHRRTFAVSGTRACRTTTRTWKVATRRTHRVALRVRDANGLWSKPVRVTVR